MRPVSLWLIFLCLAEVLAKTCFGTEPESCNSDEVALEFDQRSWQHEHGLPSGDRIWAITQTHDGYLWLGTQYGLARFDGRTFTVFDHVNTPALANEDCRTMAEDTDGNLWIGTGQSLVRKSGNRFNVSTDKLGSHFIGYPPICASRSGGVWVGACASVFLIRDDTVRVYHQDDTMPLGPGIVTALEEDEAGFLWVGTASGFGRLDVRRERFEVCEKQSLFGQFPVINFCHSSADDFWILFAEFNPWLGGPIPTTWIAHLGQNQWPLAPTPFDQWCSSGWRGRFMAHDGEGTLWLPADAGSIQCFRNGSRRLLPLLGRAKDDFVLSAFSDREGNLWIGTEKSGLQRWTPRRISTATSFAEVADENVWSIWEAHDGSVLVGTDRGVTKIKGRHYETFKRPDGTPYEAVRAVVQDLQGAIWIGTMNSLDRISNGVVSHVELPGEWFETKIRALLPGRDGAMWIGTVRGLTRLCKNERTKFTKTEGLGSDEVRAILEDRSGDLWIGTLGGGVSRLHNGRFTTLSTTNGLSSNNVWSLFEDTDGVIWIGTDNGLCRFEHGNVTSFTKAQGLPDSLVNLIIGDDFGRLWIGHDYGIYTVERNQLQEVAEKQGTLVQAVQYDESDGLLSIETNGQKSYPAACRTRDGRIWFPTTQGVAIIDPARIPVHEVAPLAAIEEVRANGSQVFGNSPGTPGLSRSDRLSRPSEPRLHLPPGGARVMEFHYTANTFVAPEKARFKYRLLGLDDHWIDNGTRRQAYFTDLRPGDYRFEVIACNHHGVWQASIASLAFYAAPFFYQTWWFYGLCGIFLVLVGGLAINWRMRESRRIFELERINALNEQRRQIARDIHDELGASLTHIMRLSSQALRTPAQPNRSNLEAERIVSIASDAVDNIGEIVWANNPEYDTLEDLVAYLREYAANVFADTEVKVRLDFPETVPDRTVTGLFRRHLVLLMKEALQNVAKHAGADSVNVQVSLHEGLLEISITDDGRGFRMDSTRRFGNGLINMRQRISEIKGTFRLNSQPGEGTEIRVVVPIDER